MKLSALVRVACGVVSVLHVAGCLLVDGVHCRAVRRPLRDARGHRPQPGRVRRTRTLIVFDLLGQLWTVPLEGGRAEPITDAVSEEAEHGFSGSLPARGRRGLLRGRTRRTGLWIASTLGDGSSSLTPLPPARAFPGPRTGARRLFERDGTRVSLGRGGGLVRVSNFRSRTVREARCRPLTGIPRRTGF